MHRSVFTFCIWLAIVAMAVGCESGNSVVDYEATEQTLLDLEYQMNADVDRNDCAAGLIHLGDREPMFVMQSQITRSADELRERCSGRAARFASAEFDISQRNVNILSPDVAYVVREGDYTMNYMDGRTVTRFGVMTTIWNHIEGTWKMVHLHESWEEGWPVPESVSQ